MFKIVANISISDIDYYSEYGTRLIVDKKTELPAGAYCIIQSNSMDTELRIDDIATVFRGRLPTTSDNLEVELVPYGDTAKVQVSLVYWEQMLDRAFPRSVVVSDTVKHTVDIATSVTHCLESMLTNHN